MSNQPSGGRRAAGGDDDREDLSALEGVVSELRADVPVSTSWKEDVLGEIRALPQPSERAAGDKRWTISPPTAIAAALAFTALGATGAATVLSVRDGAPRVASTQRPAPVRPQFAASGRTSRVHFALVAPAASHVSLVGDFNRWDASATPMRQLGDGRLWIVDLPLPPGRHVYAFVVDGDVTPDPAAPRAGEEDFGVPSSVVLVGNGAW
jgi:hypothetical protein